jgi:hypothetical protein
MYFFSLKGSMSQVRAYWAAEVPVIPDFISRRSERRNLDVTAALTGALATQRSWLARLCADQPHSMISLRYANHQVGDDWHLSLGFVGRSDGHGEMDARERAREHWEAFRATFPFMDYPLRGADTFEEFRRIFLPFYPKETAEIRRYDEIASLVEAYIPSPFSSESLSDMQSLCQALLLSEVPHIVAINLRPAAIDEDERATIAGEIRRLGELKQKSVQRGVQAVGYGVTTQKLLAEAELAEMTYRKLSNTLRQAFEMAIIVGATERISSSVLHAISADAARTDEARRDDSQLVPRALIRRPNSIGERLASFKNLFEVGFSGWGGSIAPAGLERLPRLFPLEQAHALFRLPIPDEEGVYGLPCSAFGQTLNAGRRKALPLVRQEAAPGEEISLGGVNIHPDKLTQHALITGIPGTGKTNTCLYLLDQLWNSERRVPFLVLEPAKFEYRGLVGTPGICEELLVFTAGDERIAPLRFNPFEVPRGVSLEAHVGRLIDIFRASMAMWGPLPAILEKLIRRLYRMKGWRYVGANDDCEFPRMSELYESIGAGIRALGYSRETESEATAALEVRIGRLCDGSLGKMLNTARSVDFDQLMRRPVVIEIASIGNTDDRALIMALVLNRLYQYWIVRKDQSGQGLKHVTLVEEAHNLLANVSTEQAEGQANPKGEAVQQFANMLAEIRSFGEGLIIADQSPSKLIPDIVKMTATKISHAVVADEDRRALKTSMNLTDEQAYQLALLPTGQAVIFQSMSGLCAQVSIANFKDRANGFSLNVTDEDVRLFSASFREGCGELFLPTPGCVHCPAQCMYDELTDVTLVQLGKQTEARLERDLRQWWHGIVAGEDVRAPYTGFERAFQRARRGKGEAAERRHQAFCAMTKLSFRYLRESCEAQFIATAQIAELHQSLTAVLAAVNPIEESARLRETAGRIAQPVKDSAPFEGCEHCGLKCLLRAEALRAMETDEAAEIIASLSKGARDNASLIAARAWDIARAGDLTARLKGTEQHLVYCLAIQLCEAVESRADRGEVHRLVSAGDLKFAGCAYCPSRCLYGDEMDKIVRSSLDSDPLRLKALWGGRFGKPREAIVAELSGLFSEYAAMAPGYVKASERERRVMTFCASLHGRELSPVLNDAGGKAANPHAWWGEVMAEGCSINGLGSKEVR